MDQGFLRVTRVDDRVLCYEAADECGEVDVLFVRDRQVYKHIEIISLSNKGVIEILPVSKYETMTIDDFRGMCEYWKMVAVFNHGVG